MLEASTDAIDAQGWLRTGDLGCMDIDGFVSLIGRLRDMVERGGHNVYPREIEYLMEMHPAVAETAIFGVPHPEFGEQIAAAVKQRARRSEHSDGTAGCLLGLRHKRSLGYGISLIPFRPMPKVKCKNSNSGAVLRRPDA